MVGEAEGYGVARSVHSTDGLRRLTLIPTSDMIKKQNRLVAPKKLHYEIPALGDHRLSWRMSFMAMENAMPKPRLHAQF